MDDFENLKPVEETPEPNNNERMERTERRSPHNASWFVGIILILLGIIFILQNMDIQLFENWWALFILIPAVGCFASAWNVFQDHEKQFTASVVSAIFFGFIFTLVSIVFLLNLSWNGLWPIILIMVGINIFIGSFLKKG